MEGIRRQKTDEYKLNPAGCEERIVCELLVAAGSSINGERYAANLLETFTER